MFQLFSEIIQLNNQEFNRNFDYYNQLYLPQKFRFIQSGTLEQFEQQKNEELTLGLDEILKDNRLIIFLGAKGYGKTTLARLIESQCKEFHYQKQIKPLFVSGLNQNSIDFRSLLRQQSFEQNRKLLKKFEKDINDGQIRVIIIIDDFDSILLNNYGLIQDIRNSIWKVKCKFIYFVNEQIRMHQVYTNWIQQEGQLNLYEIMQFNKSDVKDYFEQYIPWEECLSSIDLSQNLNNNIIKSIIAKIQNNQNIHNVLIKIIKLSSIVNDLEQEAGNAMMILKELKCILQNQDFSFIRMKNSSLNFLSFHKCNFEGSQMEHVDISRCWFISCNLNNVQWNKMVKDQLQFKISVGTEWVEVDQLTFANKNKFFAVGFGSIRVELWHLMAAKRLAVIRNDQNNHRNHSSTAFSSNNQLIVSCAELAKIKIQSCQAGRILRRIDLNLSNYQTYPITFSHDNQLLAIGVTDIIYIWSLNRGKQIYYFKGHLREITKLRFSKNDELLISQSWDTIRIWNIKKKKLQFFKECREELQQISFSPDLKYLAAVGRYKQIIIKNVISGFEIRKDWSNQKGMITSNIFSESGKFIACSLRGGAVLLFSLNEIKEVFNIQQTKDWNLNQLTDIYQNDDIVSLKFSTDEKYLISGNSQGKVQFYDLSENRQTQWQCSKIYWLVFSPNGKKIAYSPENSQKIIIWDIEEGKLLAELHQNEQQDCMFVTFSFDDSLLAEGHRNYIQFWNLRTSQLMSEVKHDTFIQAADFLPTELALICFSCYGDTINILKFEFPKFEMIKKQIRTNNYLFQIAYSTFCNYIASVGEKYLHIWDIKSEKAEKIFEVKRNKQIETIAFSPDGKVLASGGIDEITLWNIKQGNKISSINESTKHIKFSPNGKLLACVMKDSRIKIWNVSRSLISQDPLTLTDYNKKVDMVQFLQEGAILISICFCDGSLSVWHIVTDNLDNNKQLRKKESYSITPLYAFESDFTLKTTNSILKDSQIVSDKGVNLIQLFLQMGGQR